MTTTHTGAQRHDRAADHAAGLIRIYPLGPDLPGLNAQGLGYVRDDLLARAAGAEQQAKDAWAAGNIGLGQRCDGAASACREAAKQIVAYSLDSRWGVTP